MKNGGSIDTYLEFWTPSETADETGQTRKTYTKTFEDWAERTDLKTIKDSERVMNSSHKVSYGVTQFRLRHRDDITAIMRVKEDDLWFDIVGQHL
jgi:head-tail adaptor